MDLGHSEGMLEDGIKNEDKIEVGVKGTPVTLDGRMLISGSESGNKMTELEVNGATGSDALSIRNRIAGATYPLARSFGRYFGDRLE